MTSAEFTNVLIMIVIALIGYVSKRMIDKMDIFEKKIQEILINDVSVGKDLSQLRNEVDEQNDTLLDHENRITQLERKQL